MGSRNVAAVQRHWTHLPYRARLLLDVVAVVALDAPKDGMPERRYFGGPEFLAEIVFGTVTDSSIRQVEKCLTELVRAGALRRLVTGGKHHRAEYEISLSPTGLGGLNLPPDDGQPDRFGSISPTVVDPQPDRNGRFSPTKTVGPRNKELQRGLPEEPHHLPAPPTCAEPRVIHRHDDEGAA